VERFRILQPTDNVIVMVIRKQWPLQHVQIVTNTYRMWHKNMDIFWHFTNRPGGILFTHADNSPVSKAFNSVFDSVCVCVCVCLFT